MTVLANVMRELVGLFVDDGALALAIVAIVALAGVMSTLGLPLVAGAILLFGCLGVLLANTVSAGRR
jgi:2-keto-4-pentenoate hydratase